MTETKYNYFIGSDPSKWVSGVRSHDSLFFSDLYPGIDLSLYSKNGGLKYDLIVHPGSNPNIIRMEYHGIDSLDLINDDRISVRCGNMRLLDGPVLSYQEEMIVGSHFHLENSEISFSIEEYDETRDLIIDPLLLASTYLGGNDWDRGQRVKVDPWDRPVVAGTTDSTNFPTTIGAFSSYNMGETDIMVNRLSDDLSSLQTSTYIGGSSYDRLYDIDISSDGNVFICGSTNSTDYPTSAGSYRESSPFSRNGFTTSFNLALSDLNYSTYIGGNDVDIARDIAVDLSGNAYVTGKTFSSDFPTTNGAYQENLLGEHDAYLLKLNSEGTDVLFSTLIGGEGWGEEAYTVVVDENGYPSIAGSTVSDDYPTTNGTLEETYGFYMGFLTRFERNGSALNFSTYFANGTWIYSMDLGPGNDYYLTGMTRSIAGDFPATINAVDRDLSGEEDAFFSRISSDGKVNKYSTFLGANELQGNPPNMDYVEAGLDIFAGPSGRAYICGHTDSFGFPTTMGAYDTNRNGQDSFITVISTNGSRIDYSTFLGGSDEDEATGLAMNGSNGMYVVGNTYSNYPGHDFPTTNDSYDRSFSGGYDGYVTRFKLDSYVPEAPKDPIYFSEDSFVNLSWNEPTYDGGEPIDGYHIYRGVRTNNIYRIGSVSFDEFSYNDTYAVNGIYYTYRIKAHNKVGYGPGIDLKAMASTHPGAPSSLTTNPGNHHINLSWSRPSDDGGINYLTYSVYSGNSPGHFTLYAEGIEEDFYNITQLLNGKEYYFAISACNWRGKGPLSDIANDIPLDVPSEPTNLSFIIEPFKIILSWSPPIETGGSDNVTYRVYSGNNMTYLVERASWIYETTIDLPEVEIGQRKIYFVRAENEQGIGKRSEIVEITPLGDLSGPYELIAVEKGDHIDLKWQTPDLSGGAKNLTYIIHYGDNGSNLSLRIYDVNTTTYSLYGTITGTTYYFKVQADNSNFQSPLSEMVSATPYMDPSEPLGLTAFHGDGKVELEWSPPLDYGGCVSITYEVLMGFEHGILSPLREVNSNITVIKKLKNGVDYNFSVRAINIKGKGPASKEVTARPMSVAGKPRNLLYEEGDGFLFFRWDEPMTSGGSFNITYDVYFGKNRENLSLIHQNLDMTEIMIGELTNGILYFIYVIAINEEGPSESTSIIPAKPMTFPSEPTLLNLSFELEGVKITWSEPENTGGGDIWYYKVFRGASPGEMVLLEKISGSLLTYLDRDIDQDAIYYYGVKVETSFGESDMAGPEEILTAEMEPENSKGEGWHMELLPWIGLSLIVLLLLVMGTVHIRSKHERTVFFEE
ncbi:MAG: fibronectin type III domain-containing protein [Candidatus Thermoplasmatota archaeon]|nr:fibronectin type III domain-containing protein [Candidatus Thermoplasmatota archaeon]